MRQYLAGSAGRQADISIPAGPAAGASNLTLRVQVLNFLSPRVSSSDVTIVRGGQPVPRVFILGGRLMEASSLRPVVLQTRVIASPCLDASVQQDRIRWQMTRARPTDGVSAPSLAIRDIPDSVLAGYRLQLGRVLSIPAGVLQAGRTVTLRATVTHRLLTGGTKIAVSSSASVDIVARPSGVRASVSGGSRRAIHFDSGLVLDGRASADLDVTGRPLSLTWACRLVAANLTTQSDVLSALEAVQSLTASFASGSDCSLASASGQLPLNLT